MSAIVEAVAVEVRKLSPVPGDVLVIRMSDPWNAEDILRGLRLPEGVEVWVLPVDDVDATLLREWPREERERLRDALTRSLDDKEPA